MDDSRLREQICEIGAKARLRAFAVAVEVPEARRHFAYEGERAFHAASTYKTAVLLALLEAAADERVRLEDPLHVRNRFRSVLDGSPYRIEGDRDGEETVHKRVGRSMSLRALAEKMITRSSNLATNLLLDYLTVERVQEVLREAGVEGVTVRRGVEDLAAYEAGIVNEASAEGLVALFRPFHHAGFLPEELREEGMRILLAQEFNSMIPSRLPKGVRVAHKTGEISTHSHDAGVVLPEGAEPYLVAIMTESDPGTDGRTRAVAEISRHVYAWATGRSAEEKAPR